MQINVRRYGGMMKQEK